MMCLNCTGQIADSINSDETVPDGQFDLGLHWSGLFVRICGINAVHFVYDFTDLGTLILE